MFDRDKFVLRFFNSSLGYTKSKIFEGNPNVTDPEGNQRNITSIYKNRVQNGSLIYLVMCEESISDCAVLKTVILQDSEIERFHSDYYFLRTVGDVPVFCKRMFPEKHLKCGLFVIDVFESDDAASILRKVFDVLGIGEENAFFPYMDDAKECNNRLTELVSKGRCLSTSKIIEEIFSDYVNIVIKEN